MRDALHRIGLLALLAADAPRLFATLDALPWYGGMLRSWVDWTGLRPGLSVLEVGCGPGALCRAMAERGCGVTGIDRSPAMVRSARRRVTGTPTATILAGSLPDLPVAAGRFDLVLAASLLNVVSDRVAALRSMVRAARGGGTVSALFPTPNLLVLAPERAAAWGLTGFSKAALVQWSRSARTVALEDGVGLFEAAGLRDIQAQSFLDGMVGAVMGRAEA
ncbi:class I SAM-dependent methyltransferase [Azospirillum canadense]|uniref:class I SAM-dependent methyltransferase n=1 Tax=Azospirillum canadense TaxID=403962 RepID=UPI0022280C80|nr:class I SAM-dependent methyltransferase [Azospirillum canadense]MCW2237925.1 SAM-dependent methyltransferase [Azospirillum canadense]